MRRIGIQALMINTTEVKGRGDVSDNFLKREKLIKRKGEYLFVHSFLMF